MNLTWQKANQVSDNKKSIRKNIADLAAEAYLEIYRENPGRCPFHITDKKRKLVWYKDIGIWKSWDVKDDLEIDVFFENIFHPVWAVVMMALTRGFPKNIGNMCGCSKGGGGGSQSLYESNTKCGRKMFFQQFTRDMKTLLETLEGDTPLNPQLSLGGSGGSPPY